MSFAVPTKISAFFSRRRIGLLVFLLMLLLLTLLAFFFFAKSSKQTAATEANKQNKPALVVTTTQATPEKWQETMLATGNVFPWQEAIISAEIANLRITEVLVAVGDSVKKGQVLARIANDTIAMQLAEANAAVAELKASSEDAKNNAARATELRAKGFYSEQTNAQYQTASHTASARLIAAQARANAVNLQLKKTQIVAPENGIISAQNAVVGSLTQPAQELFRLINGNRLEWRAEISAAQLHLIKQKMTVSLLLPTKEKLEGLVRIVSPAIDAKTANALVYVDLPIDSAARAGMFASGELHLNEREILSLPQSAVALREGFAYVFVVEDGAKEAQNNALLRVVQTKIEVGQRKNERIEIISGVEKSAKIVANGVGFLTDGDLVKVVLP